MSDLIRSRFAMSWKLPLFTLTAISLIGCAQGSRVATSTRKYPRVPVDHVQILFHPPDRPYEEIGMATAQGAQLATDATAYNEVRSQAAKLGADAVIIVNQERRAYANMPGFVNLQQNTQASGSVYGNPYGGTYSGNARTQTSGIITGPSTFVGTHVTGIAIKFKHPG